jgi:hypothetical protein
MSKKNHLDRAQKLALIERSLGLRHKLKVHDSMKTPDTHEDLAILLLAKWDIEDELEALEEILKEERAQQTRERKVFIEKDILGIIARQKQKRKSMLEK